MLYSMMNLLSSHDRPRIINLLSGASEDEPHREERKYEKLSKEKYALGCERYVKAWEFLSFLPGMPTVYYGDEVGLTGMTDPFCRLTYPWDNEDLALRSKIRDINRKRLSSRVLRTGETFVRAVGENKVEVRRFIRNGKDAFGEKASDEEITLNFTR